MSGNVALTAVTNRSKRLGPVPFAMGLAVIVISGMVGLLVLSIHIQSGSVELRQAQAKSAALANEAAALAAEVDRVGSVSSLQQQASALGMLPNPHGAFIDLSNGEVSGDLSPVKGDELSGITPPATELAPPPVEIKIYPPPSPPTEGD